MTVVTRAANWIGALALMIAAGTVPAGAAGVLEKNFWLSGPRYDGVLPPCAAGLDRVASRFAEKEAKFWNSPLTIAGFEHVREVAFRPWAPNAIPRRFCAAVARVTDGHKHAVYYSIQEDTDFLGVDWDVEWCVVGLDRNLAYAPGCKQARP